MSAWIGAAASAELLPRGHQAWDLLALMVRPKICRRSATSERARSTACGGSWRVMSSRYANTLMATSASAEGSVSAAGAN
eukprot:1529287-Prorocentrum_lima.AAC.1